MNQRTANRKRIYASFFSGFLLVIIALIFTLYMNFTNAPRFEEIIVSNVDLYAFGINDDMLRSFARDTIAFLSDQVEMWSPNLSFMNVSLSQLIPPSFYAHMQKVKDDIFFFKIVGYTLFVLTLFLLYRAFFSTRNLLFSARAYYIGTLVVLLLFVGIGAWAYFDFSSFWSVLHKVFIPDGIFAGAEPIMKFFPITVFQAYFFSIMNMFLLLAGGILLMPLLLYPLSLLTKSIGKR